jgi:hypothetical protein
MFDQFPGPRAGMMMHGFAGRRPPAGPGMGMGGRDFPGGPPPEPYGWNPLPSGPAGYFPPPDPPGPPATSGDDHD